MTKVVKTNCLKKSNTWRIVTILVFLVIGILGMVLDINKSVLGHGVFLYSFSMISISLGPELAGIVIGVVVIDWLNERRQKEQAREQLREQLKRDLKSSVRDVAVNAIDELKALGWLEEVFNEIKYGLQKVRWQGASLRSAHLDDAYLEGANLEGADLEGANLEGADLTDANLEGASLSSANLKGAVFTGANLKDGDLTKAHLEGANLSNAHLEGASLHGAHLEEASLSFSHLEGAHLISTHLEKASLWLTYLEGASLFCAYLAEANLGGSDLTGTNLEEADLKGADLNGIKHDSPEQLLQAKTLKGAIMPDGTKYEEWIKRIRSDSELIYENKPNITIKQHVEDISRKTGLSNHKIYHILRNKFGVSSYKAIEDGQIVEAHMFLEDHDWNEV